NPDCVDEIVATPQFLVSYHKSVGDTVTLHLANPRQVTPDYDGSSEPPHGPRIVARIVGVGRSPLASVSVDGPGQKGGVLASPALFRHYRANIMGTSGQTYI